MAWRGGSKPRKTSYMTSFTYIQGGMATQQKSLDVIPKTPTKKAEIWQSQEFSSQSPQTTKLRLWAIVANAEFMFEGV